MVLLRKKIDARRHHAAHHATGVTSAFDIFYRTQGRFVATDQFHVVYVDIQFSSTCHPSFGLGFSNGREGKASLRNNERAIYGNVIESFEVHGIAHVRIGRGYRSVQSQPDRRFVLQDESLS